MGIDLKLLASNFRERDGEMLSTASVRLDRDPRLFSQFSADAQPCLVRLVPPGLKVGHYEDDGLKFVENDRYGKHLTFTTPEQLDSLRVPQDNDWNRAAVAFARALPPGTRIVLYWC